MELSVCKNPSKYITSGDEDGIRTHAGKQVLTILRAAGLQLKRSKCIFCAESVEYLGYRVDAAGVHATEDKVQAIKQALCPTSRAELRSFMGLVNFYGRFVKGLAHMAQPLYDLMKNTQEWHWGDAEQKAFDQLKDALSQAPVLVHYDPDLPLCLACDASGTGVGAVLAHIYPDGTERPVAFTSRTLQSSERNYSQLDREALGIIFGVTKFHQYLYGRQFKLITDNRPLAVILGPKRGIPPIAAMRLQRWAIILAAYTFEVVVKSTTENANADCMSRLPVPGTAADVATVGISEVPEILSVQLESLPVPTADIAAETAKNAVLSKVLRYVQEGAAERNVQTFKAALTAEKRGSLSWDAALQRFLGCYRTTPHTMTGKTPAALFLHRELRTRLDLLHPVLPTEVSQPATASRVAD